MGQREEAGGTGTAAHPGGSFAASASPDTTAVPARSMPARSVQTTSTVIAGGDVIDPAAGCSRSTG